MGQIIKQAKNPKSTLCQHVHKRRNDANRCSKLCTTTISIQLRYAIVILLVLSVSISYMLIFLSHCINTYIPRQIIQVQQYQSFNENDVASNAINLIIVAGHSVLVPNAALYDANVDENDWFIHENSRGLPQVIQQHITKGIQLTFDDPKSLLLFSGGQTKSPVGPGSEGYSYYRVADSMNIWSTGVVNDDNRKSLSSILLYFRSKKRNQNQISDNNTVRARTTTEEFATDSFQNILYSICRFHEVTSRYPINVTVISYTYKKYRFMSQHIPAIHWPMKNFRYIGIDPNSNTGFNLVESTKNEAEKAVKLFERDPYGCTSAKRKKNNPFQRTPPYDISCPDMIELFHHCGKKLIDPSKVPWK